MDKKTFFYIALMVSLNVQLGCRTFEDRNPSFDKFEKFRTGVFIVLDSIYSPIITYRSETRQKEVVTTTRHSLSSDVQWINSYSYTLKLTDYNLPNNTLIADFQLISRIVITKVINSNTFICETYIPSTGAKNVVKMRKISEFKGNVDNIIW